MTCQNNLCVVVGAALFDNDFKSPLSYYSLDRREHWSAAISPPTLTNELTGGLSGVTCRNKLCLAIGSYSEKGNTNLEKVYEKPMVFKSFDGGLTWSNPIFLPFVDDKKSINLNAISCNGSVCVIVGNILSEWNRNPITYNSQDGGETWSPPFQLNKPKDYCHSNKLENITCSGRNCMIIAGICYQDGYDSIKEPIIYYSHDNGISWSSSQKIELAPTNKVNNKALEFSGLTCQDQKCIAVGVESLADLITYPRVITSQDGGINWEISKIINFITNILVIV